MYIDRNNEGYHDPTAGKAIRKVHRRRRSIPKRDGLTYRLEEVKGFQSALKALRF